MFSQTLITLIDAFDALTLALISLSDERGFESPVVHRIISWKWKKWQPRRKRGRIGDELRIQVAFDATNQRGRDRLEEQSIPGSGWIVVWKSSCANVEMIRLTQRRRDGMRGARIVLALIHDLQSKQINSDWYAKFTIKVLHLLPMILSYTWTTLWYSVSIRSTNESPNQKVTNCVFHYIYSRTNHLQKSIRYQSVIIFWTQYINEIQTLPNYTYQSNQGFFLFLTSCRFLNKSNQCCHWRQYRIWSDQKGLQKVSFFALILQKSFTKR